jgi:4-amino-4-deoxy-L-arabinose transferase-like glycosyltransferase
LEIVRGFRLFALLCPLAVLICELISHPFVDMGVCDDGPYILMAKTLATTGHVVYDGWANPMLGWQLYIGAAFIKLFGFSFTAVRMSTLLVSLAIVILLHRIFVRTGVTERNATLTTLTLALTPLYLAISVT